MKKCIIEKIKSWIEQEKTLGSPSADSMVLATVSSLGKVHSRVVATREISDRGVLFFTQKRSRKANDLSQNPSASMTLWLPLLQREVVFDGKVEVLSLSENQYYWDTLPRERQLRFLTYKSGQPIDSQDALQFEYQRLKTEFDQKPIPIQECYCGFVLVPQQIYFYTLGHESFSEVMLYTFSESENKWKEQLVSP